MDEIKKPVIPSIAGILFIISGVLAIIAYLPLLSIEDQGFFGLFGCIISILSILTGIFSLQKKQWKLVIFGSFICLFFFLPLIIPGILSSIGLILVFMSKKDFE